MNVVVHDSAVGPLTLLSDGVALTGCYFANRDPDRERHIRGSDTVIDLARRELDRFFESKLRAFTVPVAPNGTPFQRSVWSALQRIPFGTTMSYGGLAKEIGSPAAVRAVGAANGANPVCIIIPCHRVIGANGSLTGFGGGLDRKRFLLALERGETVLELGA